MRVVTGAGALDRATFAVVAALLLLGPRLPAIQHLSPQSGLGYALGVVGGTMMLLLLFYPARKRIRALHALGSMPRWFRLHMFFGIAGPVCILFHSNFSLGATNSNVALVCMLIVSGSGIVGRYFYSKIHHGLYGRRSTLAELQAGAQALRGQNTALPMLPELVDRIEREEGHLLSTGCRGWQALVAPALIAARATRARQRLRAYVHGAVIEGAARSPTLEAHRDRIEQTANGYVARRMAATRKVADFRAYERLFSLWHVLHLPLFFMLLAAGIAHVFAVHLY